MIQKLAICLALSGLVFGPGANVSLAVSGNHKSGIENRGAFFDQIRARVMERVCARFESRGLAFSKCNQEPPPLPPPPPVNLDHLLITEVYYDVDGDHGDEPQNEWVEIYNGTGAVIDLSSWSIADSANADLIPEGTLLPNNNFAIITSSATTAGFWSSSEETLTIVLNNSIGSNGLTNAGDALYLKNPEAQIVDSISWGTNTDAFAPSVPGVAAGHSLMRIDFTNDTDTAADWADAEFPGPGAAG